MRLPLTLAVALSIVLHDAVAVACSCGLGAPRVVPANGATGLPINTSVFVVPDPNDAQPPSITVTDTATSATVQTVVDDHGRWLRLSAAFEANHTYDVIVDVAGTVTHSSFTTGAETDVVPPALQGITTLSLETMTWPVVQPDGIGCGGGCLPVSDGHLSTTRIELASPSDDVAFLVFARYRASDHSLIDEFVVHQPWSDHVRLGDSICNPAPVLEPGESYCGKIIAYDQAGNVAGTESEACAIAQTCEPELDSTYTCKPAEQCRAIAGPSDPGGCTSTRTRGTDGVLLFGLGGLLMLRGRRQRR